MPSKRPANPSETKSRPATKKHCPRSYTLGKRQQFSDEARERAIAATAAILAESTAPALRMEDVAQAAGITRQTLYNLFGSRAELIEAVFDDLARAGGMESMRSAMMQPSPEKRLAAMIEVFARFWSASRTVLRHIRALAATDPELRAAIRARDERRRMACEHIVRGFSGARPDTAPKANALWALTSFEFFDLLAGDKPTPAAQAKTILHLARAALGLAAN